MSTREEWPELLGKLTPSGTALVGNTDVQKVFDAIRRISGDEKRMLQVKESGMKSEYVHIVNANALASLSDIPHI